VAVYLGADPHRTQCLKAASSSQNQNEDRERA